MRVYLSDNSTADCSIDPESFWAICLAVGKGYAHAAVELTDGTRHTFVSVGLVDVRRTFKDLLLGAHELCPPTPRNDL